MRPGSRTVLVVDDEDAILELVAYNLRQAGFTVRRASDGAGAIAAVTAAAPDLVVLDVMLPDLDGFEVCRRIRAVSGVPVLFLTARGDERDKVAGLGCGDDYLTKPFSVAELVARARALLRRAGAPDAGAAGPLRLDPAQLTAQLDVGRVRLTPTEFALLGALARQPGQALSRDELLDAVWGGDYFGDRRVVDVHIKNLRDKLPPGAGAAIETVRGVGYRLQLRDKEDDGHAGT